MNNNGHNGLTIMPNRATAINKLHSELCEGLRTSLDKAIKIGELLVAQKKDCGHGDWMKWMEDNLVFGYRMAANYMTLYEDRHLLANSHSNANMPTTIEEGLKVIASMPDEPVRELQTKSPSKRGSARLVFIKKNAIPEVVEALESEKISISTAEQIAHAPKNGQKAMLVAAPAARVKPKIKTPRPPKGPSFLARSQEMHHRLAESRQPGLTREQVDPDFKGGPLAFATEYGHVQTQTKVERDLERDKARFIEWVGYLKDLEEVHTKFLAVPPFSMERFTERLARSQRDREKMIARVEAVIKSAESISKALEQYRK